ncbi:Chaperone DnaJ domain-containing protein [Rozella allomycis CSF55]|uniref:Chaperone DnaJ domain-containing protein n=1 Tax=Rozella allomycis (strain CSF55) TaxID=988480 RepID=A0A075AN52_ROZAC|nr:Chaperone DnaJ domain-containing protein [Rozella allomycis CSF55]|eukprot:EPZ31158.1 Chaperone DnaJ domain-containing protein [Rozella allomycis CSF55]
MTKDYYEILQINRNASLEDVQRSFRELSLKFHPDKSKRSDNVDKFKDVAEAYDVLSDSKTRAVFDQYGEEGLKNGIPSHPGFDGYKGGYELHGSPEEVFQKFFGCKNPFQELTLEELYHGATKKIKIQKKVLDKNTGLAGQIEKILTINVKKGWKTGTKVVFPKEGDQDRNIIPADLVFVVAEKPHALFTRQGNNLRFKAKVSLHDALIGTVLEIETLDNRHLHIPVIGIVDSKSEKIVKGEGMPISNKENEKGDLIINFEIEFPKYLNDEQKQYIHKALK